MVGKRYVRNALLSVLLFILLKSLAAQRLPEGEYHQNRERIIDILHYKAELQFNFEEGEVMGNAFLTFRPLRQTSVIFLDAIHLKFKEVHLVNRSGAIQLNFDYRDPIISIALDRTYLPTETLMVAIRYNAKPDAGLYFQEDASKSGNYFVYTYGEGGLHANWLPIYNDVNDKFSTEMLITVPPPYRVISNGKLIGIEHHQDGTRTFHWKQELPHSNYLIALCVSEFERGDLSPAFGRIPLGYWVPPGRKKEGAFVFRNTPRMVEFFSDRFQYRYPWEKYDQVAVPDYAIGAMEHTSVTGHRVSVLRDGSAPSNFGPPDFERVHTVWTAEGTISHELAHHWFGNNLTCRNLSYIWLNESFATYCQMLWDEFSLGQETFMLDRQEALDRYLKYVDEKHIIRPLEYHYFNTPDDIYNTEHTYFKGALILHMLRDFLGDEAFFRALSYYLHKHEFSNVDSQDFRIALEESTGENLDWFFDDWIYGAGHPVLEVSYTYLDAHRLVDLTVKQIQPIIDGQGLFTLPVEITLVTSRGLRKEKVWIRKQEEKFFLTCDEKPLMVSFDGAGALVAEIQFKKEIGELVYQVENDQLPGQFRALRQMARRYPAHPQTLRLIDRLLSHSAFWGLKAEAALLLGTVRTPEAQQVLMKALKSTDYRIRKAAVLALPNFEVEFARKTLRGIIQRDSHNDVVATAIVALAKTDPERSADFIAQQIRRPSWYDEITIACLKAFETITEPGLIIYIKPYVLENHHQHVRQAALQAWKTCSPGDSSLFKILMNNAVSAPYGVKKVSIEMLGSLHVFQAIPLLEEIKKNAGDAESGLRQKKRWLRLKG